ncbi:MAG: hypothetical protein ACFE9W_02360 [Promethearchaeota archaeon]
MIKWDKKASPKVREKFAKLTIQQMLSKEIKPDDCSGIYGFSKSHTAGDDTQEDF